MDAVFVTGSGGLIGSEAVKFFSSRFSKVIGIDNNLRSYFFGDDGSVKWNIDRLIYKIRNYDHHSVDIREFLKKIRPI